MVVTVGDTTLYKYIVDIVDIVDIVYDMTTTPHTLLLLLSNEKYYNLAKITKELGYFTYSTLMEKTGMSKPVIQKFLDTMRQFNLVKEVEIIKNRHAPASILFRVPIATEEQRLQALEKHKGKKITFIKKPTPFKQSETSTEKPISQFTLDRVAKFKELIKSARS